MQTKIAIVFEEDYLGSYPSFVEAIRMLSDEGYKIDILGTLRKTNFPAPPKFEQNVNFYLLPIEDVICRDYSATNSNEVVSLSCQKTNSSLLKRAIPEFIKNKIRCAISNIRINIASYTIQKSLLLNQLRFTLFVLKYIFKHNYDVVIGVDLGGGSVSYICNIIKKTKISIYWGLEISEPNQELWIEKFIKLLESKACGTADAILTTDLARAKDVCTSNNVDFYKSNCLCVPHSPKGFCSKTESNFFQNLFSLDKKTLTVLHSGWIHDVMCSRQLAKVSRNWPDNWRLIFHERMKRSFKEKYIQEVIKAGDNKTLLSLDPVDYNKIDDVILSAKIGIVIYDNYENYGNSWISLAKGSGKIAHYLKCGKPVVCRNLPGFREIIDKYECGVMFDNLSEIESAIKLVLTNYDFYQKNAFECYKQEYEFSRYFQSVIDFIKKRI